MRLHINETTRLCTFTKDHEFTTNKTAMLTISLTTPEEATYKQTISLTTPEEATDKQTISLTTPEQATETNNLTML